MQSAVKLARWPGGFRCPRCDAAAHYIVGHGTRSLFQCYGCRHQTSLIAGTLFSGTTLSSTTWFLAIYLISQAKTGLSSLALKRQLGVSYPTAWLLQHKISGPCCKLRANVGLTGSFSSMTPTLAANARAARWGVARRTKSLSRRPFL